MTRPIALAVALLLLAGHVATAQAPAAPKPPAAPSARLAKPGPKPDDEPKILSAEATARRSKASALLGGEPAGDRYGATVPWAEVPAWKRTSFFGVRSVAQTVVFVVDCSGSMDDDGRLDRAKAELRRSVAELQFPQRFTVIFYNDEPIPMPGGLLQSAGAPSKDRFFAWLRLIEPDGETDPRGALQIAMGLRPDAIYLLSDGAFPPGTVEDVASRNRKKVPIHCVDLSGGGAGDHLKRIARDSGGQYAARP